MASDYNFLFLSDLHLSEGFYPTTNKLSRNEDFFHDEAFARFLVYHIDQSRTNATHEHFRRPWKVIINGDIFDFLQVTSKPLSREAYLQAVGERPLTDSEREYGLGTSSRATVWKLGQIKKGHPLFFEALGWFLAHEGNQVLILKGNHDVELFWPEVQACLRQAIIESYGEWHQARTRGARPDSPLPLRDYLPATLEPAALSERLQFPAWFYYEPGLFYVEHGNQYDPTNAFDNFLEPILKKDSEKPAEDQRVALPSGSFFVRYFFNKVEHEHPFADNIKPLLRYVRWALVKEPLSTARLLTTHYKVLPQLLSQIAEKPEKFIEDDSADRQAPADSMADLREHEVPLDQSRWQAIHRIRNEHRRQVRRDSRKLSWGTAASVALNGSVVYSLARAMRHFVDRKYTRMINSLLAASAGFVGGTLLSGELDKLDEYVDLGGAAEKICCELNRPGADGRTASVRFLIFGHDHLATTKELHDKSEHRPPFRQWYVNTGSWLPTFDESNRLLRGDVQFTFLRIIPGLDDDRPQLLEWRPQMNSVRPIQLFGPEPRAGLEEEAEDGFEPTIEGLPDVAP